MRSERKSRRAGPVMWNGGNPGLIAQQRCLLVLRQLLGKECVAYIFSPLPPFTHTHTPPRLPTPDQKINKGRKHSKRSALIYWHFSEGDSDSEYLKKIQQQ